MLREILFKKVVNVHWVLVRIFPAFSCIRTEDGFLSVFNPNAGKYGKNTDQNNFEYRHFLPSDLLWYSV